MLGLHATAGSPLAAVYVALPPGLLASQGQFTLTGQDVAFSFVRKVTVGTGAYVLTGNDVEFSVDVSQVAISQIALVGSSSQQPNGFIMIQNFQMTAGDTKYLVVSVKDADGVAVNLTGAAVKWQAARSFGKASVLSKATSGSGIVLTNASGGIFTITLDPDDTEDLKGNYYHEAQVTASDGTISTVLFGTMKINPALIEAT